MKQIKVGIKGMSPLLMHRFPNEPVEAIEKKSPEDQAEIAAYRTPDGKLYVPAIALSRAIVSGATYSKGKGRGSLQKQVAACVFVTPETILLNQKKYNVDSRPVVIPATKGRVMRHRPRFDDWKLAFTLEFDENLLMENQLRKIMDDTGSRVGLLDFRPEKKGSFGRFMITKWA